MSDLFPGERFTPTEDELRAGVDVEWHYVPRGGYGFGYNVPAVIVKVGKRATIDAQLRGGGTVRRVVAISSLRLKEPR